MARERILLTGASRGIGAAAAARLAHPHRELILVARSERDLEQTCSEVRTRGGHATHMTVDLGDSSAVATMLDALERDFGDIDGLILNAGMSNNKRFADTSRASLERELAVNYLAPAEVMLRLVPKMASRQHGSAVIVGSLASIVPFPGNASYAASKAALWTLVRSLRIEHKASGIHLGAVVPGLTSTKMTAGSRSLLPSMSADRVAEAIGRCYEKKTSLEVPGTLNGLAARLFGAFPDAADSVLSRVADLLIPSPHV
jgi:short-subunit dehydrogenase